MSSIPTKCRAFDRYGLPVAVRCLRGFIECLPDATLKGVVYGAGVYEKGEIKTKPAMEEAYLLGRNS